jgi:glycosyltransferase involved in cell wall biosynthesis
MAHEFCQNLNKVIYKNEGKDDLYIFYSNIDILVNPTIDETYGLMSIEAASFGVPTITVSESPILSIMGIENVYVTNNPREAVNVIEDINKNRKNFEIMSDQVLRRSKVFLSPDEFAIEISKVYFRILEK